MGTVSKREIELFWRSFSDFIERRRLAYQVSEDWQGLGVLKGLELSFREAVSGDSGAISIIAQLAGVLDGLSADDPLAADLAAFAHQCAQILEPGEAALSSSQENLARRLYSMHRFLDGVSGVEHFGAVQTGRDEDIRYGLGIGLKDGSMLKFFTRLMSLDAGSAVLARSFDDEADELQEAVQCGQAGLEQYFSSQMILRYDPMLFRIVYGLSDSMVMRLGRLGTEPEARTAQIDMLAGKRFSNARRQAHETGIRSLRGFAMLFDLNEPVSEHIVHDIEPKNGEAQKCLSLADAVISRMHGHMAVHWQNRLESVFHGAGNVDGRVYDERRFLGDNVEKKNWEQSELAFEDENVSVEPEEGHTYIVCAGDRLSALTARAYHGHGDYRFVLRQNPHILQPEILRPGTRLYFPELKKSEEVSRNTVSASVQVSDDGQSLGYAGRVLTKISPMTSVQKESFCRALEKLSERDLLTTDVVPLPVGCALVCRRVTLVMSIDENRDEAARLFPADENPVMTWMSMLAAEIRGDVILQTGVYLPLATLPMQPHRRAWIATSLHRIIQDESALPLSIQVHARAQNVDVVDAAHQVVLRLEEEDFYAIRQQPHRRFEDYIAPPVVQMDALTQIWLSGIFEKRLDIAVPPLSHANQYAVSQPDGTARLLAPMGTPVYPVMRGTIVDCGRIPGFGYGILIRHDGGLYCRYTNLASVGVRPGQDVYADTMIARSGCGEICDEPMLIVEFVQSKEEIRDLQMFHGDSIGYFEIVGNLWPVRSAFECIMGE